MVCERENHQRSLENQTDREREGKRRWDGREIECRQYRGLITQTGTRGEKDERKEQRALVRERESIVGEKTLVIPSPNSEK